MPNYIKIWLIKNKPSHRLSVLKILYRINLNVIDSSNSRTLKHANMHANEY